MLSPGHINDHVLPVRSPDAEGQRVVHGPSVVDALVGRARASATRLRRDSRAFGGRGRRSWPGGFFGRKRIARNPCARQRAGLAVAYFLARRITMPAPEALANLSPGRSGTTEPKTGLTVLAGRLSSEPGRPPSAPGRICWGRAVASSRSGSVISAPAGSSGIARAPALPCSDTFANGDFVTVLRGRGRLPRRLGTGTWGTAGDFRAASPWSTAPSGWTRSCETAG